MNSADTRNFCIIAHIDHGKSTLADRMLEITGTVEPRRMRAQYLDQMELERERGITIKMAPVRMVYHSDWSHPGAASEPHPGSNPNQHHPGAVSEPHPGSSSSSSFVIRNSSFSNSKCEYILNLIDTPGHSDFSYEVSRALAAVEGAVLLVDATQGIQAQTLANFHSARRAGLKIIGAVNKVDLNPDDLEGTVVKVARLVGCAPAAIHRVSGKTGLGVAGLLDNIVVSVPPPALSTGSFRALIFDSLYDDHQGDIAFTRVIDGDIKAGAAVHFLASGASSKIKSVGVFVPQLKETDALSAGDIGYLATGLKNPDAIKIGDTIVLKGNEKSAPLPGYREPQPVVFVSFYPHEAGRYDELKSALSRLRLTDSALTFEPDMSEVLGRGFKCGFLGRLHFEIIAERVSREFNLEILTSFPSVAYRVRRAGRETVIYNPKDFPDDYDAVLQPMVTMEIITPPRFLNRVVAVGRLFHWSEPLTENLDADATVLKVKIPLADLIRDFDDKLKSATEGFASLSYELTYPEPGEVAKLEILVAGAAIPGLTRVIAKDELDKEGRAMLKKLKDLLPRQQFPQALQAKALGRIIARETIPALRKDVTGYLYGGDRTRKMKLWKKQARGKKRLKEHAHVEISPSVFKELLKK